MAKQTNIARHKKSEENNKNNGSHKCCNPLGMESLVKWIPSGLKLWLGVKADQKLLYLPDADNKPEVKHEISEPTLFRFLLDEKILQRLDEAEVEIPEMLDVLKDIDKQSKITQVEAYQSSMGKATDFKKAFHVFIVFKSTSETADDGIHWWSLEKNTEYIVLQRCRNKENVKEKFKGEERNKVKLIKEDLKGKGTIQDLFEILWAQQLIAEKYHTKKSNRQSLVTFVGEQITEIGYKYKGNFKYSPPRESGRDKQMLDLINIPKIHSAGLPPLFHLIEMENTDLFDKMIESDQYDINASYDGLTPLHYAIENSKTKMVQHLLKPEMNADPTRPDASGRTALQLAATTTMKEEIFDLLLAHDKVNIEDADENGWTALHYSAFKSNEITSEHLIKKGANVNHRDITRGHSPLHVAAMHAKDMNIVELLLNHPDLDVDCLDKWGRNALYYATLNENGLGEKIFNRLKEKGAVETENQLLKRSQEILKEHRRAFSDQNPDEVENFLRDDTVPENGVNALHVTSRYAKTTYLIDNILEKGKFDINGVDSDGRTPLHYAIMGSYSTKNVPHLIRLGADPNIANKTKVTPLHLAAKNEETAELIDIILETGQCNINTAEATAAVNPVDNDGRTPLHYAIKGPKPITINARRLIKMGADPGIADKNGVTPLHMAARNENAESMDLIELLLNTEAVDVNCVDKQGRTPLACARVNKHGLGQRIIARLKESGANECVLLSILIDRNAVLGIGGYGTVFKGKWNSKIVAVKRIELAKFENNKEEEALQKLDHPHVVKLYHVESDPDFRYYALELCHASLDQIFHAGHEAAKKYRKYMPKEKEVFYQLAKGLAHIHEMQLIHRDIKPENTLIWVDSTGGKVLMKWADFGLSKQVNPGGSHSISEVRGTRNWYSPEILKIKREGNDGRTTTTSFNIRPRGTVKSDVFSAGLVFGYYLLGGHHPFGSGYDIEQNIVNNEPVNLTTIDEQQHPMRAIIMDMLKHEPGERISSADVITRITSI